MIQYLFLDVCAQIIMKNFLIILLGIYTFSANTGELKRESSGFSETEEFKFENNTVIHYKNKTTWKDNLGNYGLSNCLGLIVTDFNKEIIDYKMYCKYLKSFILQNNQIFNKLLYQKDSKICLKEFLLMVASILNYVSLQPMGKKSTILTTQII